MPDVSDAYLARLRREIHLLRVVAMKANAFLIAPYLGEHQRPLAEALAEYLRWQEEQRGSGVGGP